MSNDLLRAGVFFVFAGLLAGGVLSAADEPSLPFSVTSYKLKNGIEVILSEDSSLPLVSVVLAYHVGSYQEQPGKSGLAYLLENLMFTGSQNIGPMQHISFISRIGGEPNASTTEDITYFYETVPANQLGLVLWLESDRMKALEIDAAKTERAKQALLDELSQRKTAEPYLESSWAFDRLVFPDFAHNHNILGREEDIRNLTVEDIKGFYSTFYVPNNAVLVIVGNINLPKTRELVDKYFETIPEGKDVSSPPRPRPPEKKSLVQDYPEPLAPYAAFHLGYRISAPYTADYYGFVVLDYLLLRGKASRLYKHVIRRESLAFGLSGGVERRKDVAAFKIFAMSNTETAADLCQKAILSEIGKLRLNPVSEDELDRAKNIFKRDYVSRFSTMLDKAMFLADVFFSPVGLDNAPRELAKYLRVTPAELKDLSLRFLAPENCIILNVKTR
jgi:predicted Zn-dependent peptidase